jgi:hypothetical protein
MELGDIINILLVIAFAIVAPIVGAVSKRSKTKQQAGSSGQTNADGFGDDNQLVDSEWESPESVNTDSRNLQTETAISESQKQAYNSTFTRSGNESDISDKNYTKINERKNERQVTSKELLRRNIKQVNSGEAVRIAKGFNIKKAVIFSEILNTKYF